MESLRIQEQYIKDILENHWGITGVQLEIIKKGQSTKNWLIEQEDQVYILRDAGTYESYVKLQIQVLEHLRKVECFPYITPHIRPLINGEKYLKFRDSLFYLYYFIPGDFAKYCYSENYIGELIQLIKHFHLTLVSMKVNDDCRSKDVFNNEIQEARLSRVLEESNSHQVLSKKLDRYYVTWKKVRQQLIPFLSDRYNELPRTLCHCDWNTENVIISDKKIIGLLDFGGICKEPLIFDIQNALFHCMVNTKGISAKKVSIFLDSLDSLTLSTTEKNLIYPTMLADLSFTLSWLMEQGIVFNKKINLFTVDSRISALEWLLDNKNYFINLVKKINP